MMVYALGPCDPRCAFCAREFLKWLRGRMNQMSIPRRGESISFAEAAATSIGAKRD